jgi:hypothetical protein
MSRPRIVFHEIEPQLAGARLCERECYNQIDSRLAESPSFSVTTMRRNSTTD